MTVRPALATAVALAAAAAAGGWSVAQASSATAPAPAHRTGTTAGGVPFALHGRTLRITVPATTKRGRRIAVHCGRQSTADLLPGGFGFRAASEATGSGVFRQRRRMTIRLNRDVSAIAEWCEFETRPGGKSGAAILLPRRAAPPAPLASGPGVREGRADEDGGRFYLDGSTLTLRTDKALPGDIVLFLACYAMTGSGEDSLRILGARSLAIGHGRRSVTADLGADVESSQLCLAESASDGGHDLYTTEFKLP